MTRTLWINAKNGLAGDMLCGALLDAGGSIQTIKDAIAGLDLKVELSATRVQRGAFSALHFVVTPLEEDSAHRHLKDITSMIKKSLLSDSVKDNVLKVFLRLAEAEALVHGVDIDEVHFHEVGAMDSIVDIVGFCVLIDALKIQAITASPIGIGQGSVQTAHGRLSVPVPAVIGLCNNWNLVQSERLGEQCTPTGAALITTLAKEGPMPSMRPIARGVGAGTRNPVDHANITEIILGESRPSATNNPQEQICELDCQIDDMTPELIPALLKKLMEQGAVDAFCTPILMKKGRPGFALKVICFEDQTQPLTTVLFEESTTLGVRQHTVTRQILVREIREITTPWGPCRIKLGFHQERLVNIAPEFEDCNELAREAGVPLKTVYATAMSIAHHEKASWLA